MAVDSMGNEIDLLKEIEANLVTVEMDLDDSTWLDSIPSGPGWYLVETDTPTDIFNQVDPPQGKYNYNLPKKFEASMLLQELGICIVPKDNPLYIVYSGEARNLRTRAREIS